MVSGPVICAFVALLADAEGPPAAAPSNTGTVVVVLVCLAIIVLISVVLLSSMAHDSRTRAAEVEDQARRGAGDAEGSSRSHAEEMEDPR